MNHDNDIVLFTGFPSSFRFGGGAIVRKIISASNNHYYWFYQSNSQHTHVNLASESAAVVEGRPLTDFYIFDYIKRFKRFFTAFLQLYWIIWKMRPYRNKKLWVVLDSNTITISYGLVKYLKWKKIHFSVHDDARFDYYGNMISAKNHKKLRYILKASNSIDFIGINLLSEYQQKFALDNQTLEEYRITIQDVSPKMLSVKKEYSLIFIGSSHSLLCWRQLVNYLNKQTDYLFKIDYYGTRDLSSLDWGQNIHFSACAILDEDKLLMKRDLYDFGLFFWEDMTLDRLMYSVSTKLTSYLKMGLPLMGLVSDVSEIRLLKETSLFLDITTTSLSDFLHNFDQHQFDADYHAFVASKFDHNTMQSALEKCRFFNLS